MQLTTIDVPPFPLIFVKVASQMTTLRLQGCSVRLHTFLPPHDVHRSSCTFEQLIVGQAVPSKTVPRHPTMSSRI